jgi:hypothetical protein
MRGKFKHRPVTLADLRKRFLKALYALPVYLPTKLPPGWTKEMLAPTDRLRFQYDRAEADVRCGVPPALILLAQGYNRFYEKLDNDQRDALHDILFEREKDPQGEEGLGPPLIERLSKDRKAFNGTSPDWRHIVRKYSSRLNRWPYRLRRAANAAAHRHRLATENKERLARRESRQAARIDGANEALEKGAITEMEHRLWVTHIAGEATQKELRGIAGVKTQGAVSKKLADITKVLAIFIEDTETDDDPLYPLIFVREGPGRCNLCGKPVWWRPLNLLKSVKNQLVYYEPTNVKGDSPSKRMYAQHMGGSEPPPHGTAIPVAAPWVQKLELANPNEKNYDRLQPHPGDKRHRCGKKDKSYKKRRRWLSKPPTIGGAGWPGPETEERARDWYPVVGYPPPIDFVKGERAKRHVGVFGVEMRLMETGNRTPSLKDQSEQAKLAKWWHTQRLWRHFPVPVRKGQKKRPEQLLYYPAERRLPTRCHVCGTERARIVRRYDNGAQVCDKCAHRHR